MFDFASALRHEGDTPGLNDKGLVTADRKVRKDAFYFYKANWSEEPVVYVAGRRFTPRAEPIADVKVYSNLPRVELKVNGASFGTIPGDDEHVFRWQAIPLHQGENRIEAIAADDTHRLVDACLWYRDSIPSSSRGPDNR